MLRKALLITMAIGLFSCGDPLILDSFHELPEEGWAYDRVITDSAEILDSTHYYQFYANFRVSSDYPYRELYLRIGITYPDGSERSEVALLPVTDKAGKWLGSGIGSTLTYQVPIKGKRVMDQVGMYHFRIQQESRNELLEHVRSVGLHIRKQEEIF